MKYELGVVGESKITTIRELSESEYQECSEAINRLTQFENEQSTFLAVKDNYEEYLGTLDQYSREYGAYLFTICPQIELARHIPKDVNRRILNYLSAVRTYLDHSEYNLKKRYGEDSEEVTHFKKACSDAYDTHFSYRFVSRLRNYVQHCGMPLGKMQIISEETDVETRKVIHYFTVSFDRDELLRKYDRWGQQVADELRGFPELFEIAPHLSDAMGCLTPINRIVVEERLRDLRQSVTIVQGLVRQVVDVQGTPGIFRYDDVKYSREGEVTDLKLTILWMPVSLLDTIGLFIGPF
jgi:hypothetical protein